MDWSCNSSHDFKATQDFLLLYLNFRQFCTMLYFEPDGVPYMDRKIYESSFTRTWNLAISITEEEVMVETMTEGQSGRKRSIWSPWSSTSRPIQRSSNRASEQRDLSSTARSLRTWPFAKKKHANRSQTSMKEETFEELRDAIKELTSDNASMRGLINRLAKDINKTKTSIGPQLILKLLRSMIWRKILLPQRRNKYRILWYLKVTIRTLVV